MRIAVRSLRRVLIGILLAGGTLTLAGSALADYTGPDRKISVWEWKRLECRYQAEYDEPGPGGYYSCTLRLYEPPDEKCPSNVGDYFNPTACVGWPGWLSCDDEDCDISRSSSLQGCSQGQQGCRAVERIVSQPPATIDGSLDCSAPGSGNWCRTGATLSLSGAEPLSGYEILALEGTYNGAAFACPGSACSLPLAEGTNDFSYWALSSYGDTSEMGSTSVGVDTHNPSLSGSVSGASGDDGWYISEVIVEASADDPSPGSGLSSLDVQVDGGEWASYGGPLTLGDGSHTVELRAVDGAGNAASESLGLNVDTQPPFIDLAASPSFCPRCGETLGVTLVAQDGGSGIVDWSLVASGKSIAGGSAEMSGTIDWDGGGLKKGAHTLYLEGRDAAGNVGQAELGISIIVPTPHPKSPDDEATETSPGEVGLPTATEQALVPSPSATLLGGSAGSPLPTRTPRRVVFGAPTSPPGAGLPAAPQGPPPGQDPISNLQSPPAGASAATSSVSPVLYGAAAAALVATVTAIGLEQKRKREEEEARVRAEMEAANAQAEAADAEWRVTMGAIVAAAEAARQAAKGDAAADERMAKKEEMLEPKIPPPPPPLDMAKLKQADYAAGEAWVAAHGYATYKKGEQTSVPYVVPVPEKAWWEKAIDWVDQHQTEVAIGLGVVAAAAAIVLTGGIGLPVVAAIVAAGAVSAAGTVGLNAHYDRPLGDNVLRNGAITLVSGAVTAGAVALATGGILTKAAIGVGNTVARACAAAPSVCALAGPAMTAFDTGEQLLLSAQLAIQTATGDPRAGETYLELQLEQMDGGVPGNTALRELGEVGGDAVAALARYGDEGAAMAEVVAEHSDDVVDVLDSGIVVVQPGDAQGFAEDLLSNLKALEGGDIRVYYSSASGAVYTSAPTANVLEAVEELSDIVNSGRTSGADVDALVRTIAEESSRGSGGRVVLGEYGANGVYIHEALDNGGTFYDTGGVVYERLLALNEKGFDPTVVNEAFLRVQMEHRVPRIEIANETIEEVLTSRGASSTASEIRYLSTWAAGNGYVREGNAWVFSGQ